MRSPAAGRVTGQIWLAVEVELALRVPLDFAPPGGVRAFQGFRDRAGHGLGQCRREFARPGWRGRAREAVSDGIQCRRLA